MSKFITFLATLSFVFCSLTAMAQPQFLLIPQDADATQGQTVNVDVKVVDFTDLASYQFNLTWNPSLLTFQSVTNLSALNLLPPPAPVNFGTTNAATGTMVCSWTDPGGLATTLTPDSMVIFTLVFELAEDAGAEAFISFSPTLEVIQNDMFGIPNDVTNPNDFIDGPATESGYGGGPVIDPCLGATGFTIVATNDTIPTGSQVCIDVQVCNFTDIVTAQYTMEFDPSLLRYDSVSNLNLAQLTTGAFGANNATNGLITFSWFDSLGTGVTVPNGTVIYSMCFTAVGAGGSRDTLQFTSGLTNIDVTDVNSSGSHIGMTSDGGEVMISGMSTSALTVGVSGDNAMNGDQVCLDVSVNNFNSISGMQYTMEWDETVLAFDQIMLPSPLTLTPLDIATHFNTTSAASGSMTFQWDIGTGLDLNNGDVIYQVCFDVIGMGGDFSLVEFTNTPTPIQALQEDAMGMTQSVTIVTQSSQVNVLGVGGFRLIAEDTIANTGDTVCIDVRTTGFNAITSMQYTLEWDTAVVEFIGNINDNILPAQTFTGITNIANGTFTFQWLDVNATGVTLPDSTVLYNFCFKVKGANGTMSPIRFTNGPPTTIEASQDDGTMTGNLIIIPMDTIPGSITVGTVAVDPIVVSDTTITHLNCAGDSDGAIDITVMGGTPAYTYAWSTTAATEDVTGLTAGTYTVTISDSQGQSITESYTVTEPSAVGVSGTPTHVTCAGADDGSIDITATGGTTPYTYTWSDASLNGTEDPSSLAAGAYTTTVTDANGCTATTTVTINAGATIGITDTPTHPGCAGDTDGSIALDITGGTTPYTYTWNDASLNGTEDPTGLGAGTYTVTVADANSCSANATIVLNAGVTVGITATPTHPGCGGAATGSIALDITGGTTPYTYTWNDASLNGTEDPTGLAPGTYTVTVTESGSSCSATETIIINNGSTLNVTATPTAETCAGLANGSIDLDVTAGSGTYSFVWSDASLNGIEDPTGLPAGPYTVTVTDDNTSCTATATTSIAVGVGVNVGATKTDVTCNGNNDGTITTSVSGGSGNYTYVWDPASLNGIANPTGLGAGTYTVTVTEDGNNCSNVASVTISEAAAISVGAVGTGPTCNGESTGSIDLNVSGGVAGYGFTWNVPSLNGMEDPTGLVAGTYTVTITDAVACTFVFSIPLSEPAVLAPNGVVTHESMPGFNDGEIALGVTGGTPNYMYDWGNPIFNGQSTISGLTPGNYNVTITDAAGCTTVGNYVVNAADAPIPNVTLVTNVSCNGANDGAITIDVTGGTPNYTYAWSNMATTQNLTGLAPGSYTVTVTDANMTIGISQTVIIDEPAVLTATAVGTDASCAGTTDGSIDVTVNGGTANYNYSWTGGLAAVENPTGVAGGTYSVTITDANGCIATASATVNTPTAINIDGAVITDVACNGEASGGVDISVSGGAGNYTYAWSDAANTSTEDLSNVGAGTYTVTITDGDGCSMVSGPMNISETAAIDITNVDVTDVVCPEVPTGAIDITVAGGTAPYSYNWVNNIPASFSVAEDPVGLRGGTYTVEITDSRGCMVTSNPITVQEPQPINIVVNVTNTSISNDDGGIAVTSATGGTGMGTFNYNWSGPNGYSFTGPNQNITGLSPGYYYLTATDANGCIETMDSILVNGMVDATDQVTHVSCSGGSDGAIDITVMGGIAPFSYEWDPNGSQLEDQIGLTAGTYTVTITDVVGSEFIKTFTILEPAPILLTNIDVTPETGLGCNGGINITVSGGTAPYSYIWSNGMTSQDAFDLCKGKYSVDIIDANGCILQSSDIEVLPPPLSLGGTPTVTNVQCNGAADGNVCLSVLGGCEPYNFLISGGANVVSLDGSACFDNLPAGNHTVTVTDVFGGIVTVPFTVSEPSPITADVVVTDNDDATGANCNGSIQITPAGGTAPYNYQWNNGAISEDISELCSDLSPYSVTITDENGCNFVIRDIVVRSIQFAVTDVSCADECDGEIDVTIVGGKPPYTYSWADGSSDSQRTGLCADSYEVTIVNVDNEVVIISSITVDGPSNPLAITDAQLVKPTGTDNNGSIDITVNGGWGSYSYMWTGPNGYTASVADPQLLVSGQYSVIIIDANGCQVTGSYDLEAEVIKPNEVLNRPLCSGEENGSIVLNPEGGVGPYTFQWSTDPADNDPALGGLLAGTYTVTITDAGGLSGIFEFVLEDPDPIVITFDNPGNGSVTANITGGTPPYSLTWNTDARDTTASLSGLSEGVYDLLVLDSEECQAIGRVMIRIDQPGVCDRVRHIITPNDDGNNDNFKIICDDNLTLDVQIFDRWGRLVFRSENYADEWIGNDANGDKLPEGGYFYVLEYTDPLSGDRKQEKGHITLIR